MSVGGSIDARRILAAWLAVSVLALAAPNPMPTATAPDAAPERATCHCQAHVEMARAAARTVSFEDACAPAPARAAAVSGVPFAPPVAVVVASAPQGSCDLLLLLDGNGACRSARPESPPPRVDLPPA